MDKKTFLFRLLICFIAGWAFGFILVNTVLADIGGSPTETPYVTPEPIVTAAPTLEPTLEPTVAPTVEPTVAPTPVVTPQVTIAPTIPPDEDILLDQAIMEAITLNKEAIEANATTINILVFLATMSALSLLIILLLIHRINKVLSSWLNW